MKPYQHFWGMTAILSALLLGNLFVSRTGAQQTAAVPDVLTAREIRLVNSDGLVRIKLSAEVNGVSQIQLFNPEGKKQLELSVDGDERQPSVRLFDEGEKLRFSVSALNFKGDGRAPQIGFYDVTGKQLVNLGINPNLRGDLFLSDHFGGSLSVKPDALFFLSPQNSKTTGLFAYKPGSPGLAFAEEDGKYVWTAPNKKRR